MKDQLIKVLEFYRSFKIPFQNSPKIPDIERCMLRHSLMNEEVNECLEGFKNRDLKETLDALCDMQYILIGTILELGLQDVFEDAFAEVHRSNMTKLDANGLPLYREDGKIKKSELYEKPNLSQFL